MSSSGQRRNWLPTPWLPPKRAPPCCLLQHLAGAGRAACRSHLLRSQVGDARAAVSQRARSDKSDLSRTGRETGGRTRRCFADPFARSVRKRKVFVHPILVPRRCSPPKPIFPSHSRIPIERLSRRRRCRAKRQPRYRQLKTSAPHLRGRLSIANPRCSDRVRAQKEKRQK